MSPPQDAAVKVGAMLLNAPSAGARATLVASVIVEMIPDSACAVHRLVSADGNSAWTPIGIAGDISIERATVQDENLLLFSLLTEPAQPLIFPGSSIRRENYPHLNVTRSVASIAYLPLLNEGLLMGAIEILTFSSVIEPAQLEDITPIVQLTSPAILAAEGVEQRFEDLLDSSPMSASMVESAKAQTLNAVTLSARTRGGKSAGRSDRREQSQSAAE